ncbi:hypothetical protein FPHYL_14143 [Fusarium phyllophilum]|uniref:NmrA-like domain-containing protein n=1 Tax=Fusarium phyllophilum TaxID=47803 RepID=A0A8H5MIE3_9HYPO|nr:hypothetical protein FPHYL_14143 [Fusarium phyllophilum]
MAAKRVAVVGGSGHLGRESQAAELPKGVAWRQVDYNDKSALVGAMKGIDTVLSFLAMLDQNEALELHKKLIDAAIEAGVRRFAPSEWARNWFSASNSGVAHYRYKDEVRKYLEEANSNEQPGMFTDYFGHPRAKTKHFNVFYMFADFQNRRAIIPEDPDAPITLTTVRDMSRVVAQALEYNGVWPTVGGMQGTAFTVSELVALGEKLRGPFKVEKISNEDLEARNVTTSWYPVVDHHALPDEMREQVSKGALVEYLAALKRGVWTVSDEWNKLLPDFQFTSAESYLKDIWR